MNGHALQASDNQIDSQVLLLLKQIDYLNRQLFSRKREGGNHPDLVVPDTSGELGKRGGPGDVDAPEDETQAATGKCKEPARPRKISKDLLSENVPLISHKESCGAALPIRLVLVEDDPSLLGILADALAAYSDFEVLSCHGSAEEALAIADWERCTILLADLSLPGLGGVELIRQAKASRPGLIAAAYTVNDRQQDVLGAIRAGASGYILKHESLDRLVEAITELATGGAPITPSVASMILDVLRNEDPDTAAPRLSPREQNVLRLVADGYMHKEIASFLSVSLHTVQSHTKRIYKKLEAKGRLEAVAKARLSGLL